LPQQRNASERRQRLKRWRQGRQGWRWRNWQQRWRRMQRMQRRQSSRLCAPVAPTALFLPTTTDNELKLAREAAREQAAQWAAAHPYARCGGSPDGRGRAGGAPGGGARGGRVPDGAALPPGQVPWSPWDPGHCQGRRSRRRVAYPHHDQLRRVGHGDEGTALGAAHVEGSSIRRR
jgi:hypothetical protein